MVLEKNPKTRPLVRNLLALGDKVSGLAFPSLVRPLQINSYSCGPAVIAALYSFLGVRASQKGIVASLRVKEKIKKYGLNIKEMGRAAKMVGKGVFTFWKKSNSKISNLDLIINKYKSPVGVEWQGVFYEDTDEDDGHYAIITKLNKKAGYLRIADPYKKFAGVDRKFDIKFFEKRWWDENDIKISGTSKKRTIRDNRIMFVITPKGATWPKKLGMVRG